MIKSYCRDVSKRLPEWPCRVRRRSTPFYAFPQTLRNDTPKTLHTLYCLATHYIDDVHLNTKVFYCFMSPLDTISLRRKKCLLPFCLRVSFFLETALKGHRRHHMWNRNSSVTRNVFENRATCAIHHLILSPTYFEKNCQIVQDMTNL
jgi:hypothetical protein